MDILANLGTNRATNIFTLKFLLCSGKQAGTETHKKKDQEEEEAGGMKGYAMTSYLKLITARVIKLEQEMARHKKVSLVMVGGS